MMQAATDHAAREEREKYEKMWAIPQYRDYSPGAINVDRFMSEINPQPGSTLLDAGCGQGKAGLELQRRGLDVWYLDITDAALDPAVPRHRFHQAALWAYRPPDMTRFDYAFCCDVLEHIPPEYALLCVERLVRVADRCWLQIALVPDSFGQRIGQPLHLTVRPFVWWKDRIGSFCQILECRDLCGQALFVVRAR